MNERYLVYATGPELFDPDTNEALGSLEMVRGTGYVSQVQENISVLKSMETKRVPRLNAEIEQALRPAASNLFVRPARVANPRDFVNEPAPFDKASNGDYAKRV